MRGVSLGVSEGERKGRALVLNLRVLYTSLLSCRLRALQRPSPFSRAWHCHAAPSLLPLPVSWVERAARRHDAQGAQPGPQPVRAGHGLPAGHRGEGVCIKQARVCISGGGAAAPAPATGSHVPRARPTVMSVWRHADRTRRAHECTSGQLCTCRLVQWVSITPPDRRTTPGGTPPTTTPMRTRALASCTTQARWG